MRELKLLAWIRRRIGKRGGRIVVDSGDDCAVLDVKGERVLVKVDSVIEGVHFTARDPRVWVGNKAMARPLSDIAAMGGVPVAALAALMMPRGMKESDARAIYRGMEKLGVPVVGGDVTSHAGALAVSVTVFGEMRGVKPVLRRGAKPGDFLVVTGRRLGGSLKSGRHLRFKPRLAEGRLLATKYNAHAMIDISDGLVRDLAHVCEASGVGAALVGEFDAGALYDGEDYELLAALDAHDAARAHKAGVARPIGIIVGRPGVTLNGKALAIRGYEH